MKKLFLVLAFLFLSVSVASAQQSYPSWIQYYPPAGFSGGTVTSPILFPAGTAAAPSWGWVDDADGSGTGAFRPAANTIGWTINGSETFRFDNTYFRQGSLGCVAWNSAAALSSGSLDAFLCRDAANTLAQRNGINAQEFRVYITDNGANDEYLRILAQVGSHSIITGQTGTGQHRPMIIGPQGNSAVLDFQTQALNRWRIDASGHFVAGTDNTYDIGASGATRPRNIYVAGFAAISGTANAGAYATAVNCSSSAAPAVCSSAAAGSVVIAAGGTSVTVNTTAVTANSQIFIQEDSSLGTKLSVTCNTVTTRDYYVTARTAATSFTITASAAPVTNPACLSYFIVN